MGLSIFLTVFRLFLLSLSSSPATDRMSGASTKENITLVYGLRACLRTDGNLLEA